MLIYPLRQRLYKGAGAPDRSIRGNYCARGARPRPATMLGMSTNDPLGLFLPTVGEWFRTALGPPTPPQRLGWPAIAAGQNTLILAPTGSGKTLAAFLACLDALWREHLAGEARRGVRVLYISPLKALNNDIHRNLQMPLEGVTEVARQMGTPLP